MFQFTPLREGRRKYESSTRAKMCFNSRPCVRGDIFWCEWRQKSQFQFTPLREGRPLPRCVQDTATRFQFTPLREGRLRQINTGFFRCGFNSRPCVRGDFAPKDK